MSGVVAWPEAHLRRAMEAVATRLKQGAPFDAVAIARVALEGAVRSQSDLEILIHRPNPAFQPKKKRAAAAASA